MSFDRYDLIIIIPVYEDLESLKELILNIKLNVKEKFFIIAVDDCSIISPLNFKILKNADVNGIILKLNENSGHQVAIAVGLNFIKNKISEKHFVVVMDCDGEDDPKSIDKFSDFDEDFDKEYTIYFLFTYIHTYIYIYIYIYLHLSIFTSIPMFICFLFSIVI